MRLEACWAPSIHLECKPTTDGTLSLQQPVSLNKYACKPHFHHHISSCKLYIHAFAFICRNERAFAVPPISTTTSLARCLACLLQKLISSLSLFFLQDPYVLAKLEETESNFVDLQTRMADPEVSGNPTEYQRLVRALTDIQDAVEAFREYKETQRRLKEAKEMMKECEGDIEMMELAQEEVTAMSDAMA